MKMAVTLAGVHTHTHTHTHTQVFLRIKNNESTNYTLTNSVVIWDSHTNIFSAKGVNINRKDKDSFIKYVA